MPLDQDRFESVLGSIHPTGYPSELPDHVSQWLNEIPASQELKEFLASHSASAHYEVGPITMLPHRNVYSETREYPYVVDSGFLVVGASQSGDPLVLDLATEEVGFISHEELWSYSSPEELRAAFKAVAPTLGKCVESAHSSDAFPEDYYEV